MKNLSKYLRWSAVPLAALAAFILTSMVFNALFRTGVMWTPRGGFGAFLGLFFNRFLSSWSAVMAAVSVAPSAKAVVAVAAPSVIIGAAIVMVALLLLAGLHVDSWALLLAEMGGLVLGSILAGVERYHSATIVGSPVFWPRNQ